MSTQLYRRQTAQIFYSRCVISHAIRSARFSASTRTYKENSDPRIDDFGTIIKDDYAAIREKYQTPKNPVILAHGLLGFDEWHLAGAKLPGIRYWRGITDALAANGIECFTAKVSPSGSLEHRAQMLADYIAREAAGKSVNIIAGLDARYMISRLHPPNVNIVSLTTIASPHRGSAFADFMFKTIGPVNIPRLYKMLEYFGLETGAFEQLTQEFVRDKFNPVTPDREDVKYFSYGAMYETKPRFWSMFRQSHAIVQKFEGPNDGLVSVSSSKWGTYKGTLNDCSHLDLINWTNRLRWFLWELGGNKRNFNAIAFYLEIADMLAKEGY